MRQISSTIKDRLENRIQTSGNNADNKLSIIVSRAKNSVSDSNRFTVDTIREGENLGDIGIDIKRADGKLLEIYEVHNDNNIISTVTRLIPVLPETNWIEGSTIGEGKLCRICFDGQWAWSETKQKYIFNCLGDPFIFFTDLSDNLKVQVWEESSGRIDLASDVKVLSVIRAWKSNIDPEDDQGIIAAYIKSDGKLYYKNYCYDAVTESYVWGVEREITLTDVTDAFVDVSMFLTNDYRLGFVITTDADEVYWKITDRRWAGMAIRPDAFRVGISALSIERITIIFTDAAEEEVLNTSIVDYVISKLYGASPLPESLINIDDGEGNYGYYIKIVLDEKVYDLTGEYVNFTVEDSESNGFDVTAIAYNNEGGDDILNEIILTLNDFNAAIGNITVIYDNTSSSMTGEAGQDVNSFSKIFTPAGLILPVVDPPVVSSIINIEGDEV